MFSWLKEKGGWNHICVQDTTQIKADLMQDGSWPCMAEGLSSLHQGAWGHPFEVPAQMRLSKELRKLSCFLWNGEIQFCFAVEKRTQASSSTNAVWKWHGINASLEFPSYFSDSSWVHEHIKKKQKSKACGDEVISVKKLMCITPLTF